MGDSSSPLQRDNLPSLILCLPALLLFYCYLTAAINYVDTRVIKMHPVEIQGSMSSVNLCFINTPILDTILRKKTK